MVVESDLSIMKPTRLSSLALGGLCLLVSGCASKPIPTVEVDAAKLKLFKPLPAIMAAKSGPPSEEMVTLGRTLYFENRLSRSHQFSCNSCHHLDQYGVDNEATSQGHNGQRGDRNSPTVYNAASHFVQFWDGRAKDVEAQAKGPVLNPVEMAMRSEAHAVATLKSMPEYVEMFRKAFPGEKDPVTYDNMAAAIGAFERKLVTPGRWDQFLQGDANALTNEEKAGLNAFLEAGCQACHNGANLGGTVYQKLGAVKEYPDQSDTGREKVTKAEADKFLFKVPGLRNIEKTGPYYHNGKVATLKEAVARMGEYQLGKPLTDAQQESIVTFLKALTGKLPTDYIQPPALPKSGPKTPAPDLT